MEQCCGPNFSRGPNVLITKQPPIQIYPERLLGRPAAESAEPAILLLSSHIIVLSFPLHLPRHPVLCRLMLRKLNRHLRYRALGYLCKLSSAPAPASRSLLTLPKVVPDRGSK